MRPVSTGLYVYVNANETTLRQTGTFLGIDLMSLTQATILAVALLLQSPILYAIFISAFLLGVL